jgi:hypothetical protein
LTVLPAAGFLTLLFALALFFPVVLLARISHHPY